MWIHTCTRTNTHTLSCCFVLLCLCLTVLSDNKNERNSNSVLRCDESDYSNIWHTNKEFFYVNHKTSLLTFSSSLGEV